MDIAIEKAKEYSFNEPSMIYEYLLEHAKEELKYWKKEVEQAYVAGWKDCEEYETKSSKTLKSNNKS